MTVMLTTNSQCHDEPLDAIDTLYFGSSSGIKELSTASELLEFTTSLTSARENIPGLKTLSWTIRNRKPNERLVPALGSVDMAILASMDFEHSNFQCEYDSDGCLISFNIINDHPTVSQAKAWLQSQGYDVRNPVLSVKVLTDYDQYVVARADYRPMGVVSIVTGVDRLNLFDARRTAIPDGLSMSTKRDCMILLQNSGYDGIILTDPALKVVLESDSLKKLSIHETQEFALTNPMAQDMAHPKKQDLHHSDIDRSEYMVFTN